MSTSITGWDIAIRLALAVLAGGLIGFNRGEHGRAVGIRTTILVCLAACLAMVEANLLLLTTGKTSSSFVQIDPLRFPLGILTGIGFIGAGAIVKKNDLIIGLTSAATIWFVTTIGLCLGSGQLGLGLAGFVLALGTLWGLKQVEKRLPRSRMARLKISADPEFAERQFLDPLMRDGIRVVAIGSEWSESHARRIYNYRLFWKADQEGLTRPAALGELAGFSGVREFSWELEGE
jgi:putative Mg2+ transporter-C (MgtC) family protein